MFRSGYVILVLLACSVACAEKDIDRPRVVSTEPANGSSNVDPALTELTVTFNEVMMNDSWSWAYSNKDQFPTMTGQPYYSSGLKKNILPVRLEANKEYVIWINSEKFVGFKDQAGNSALPFKFYFKTK